MIETSESSELSTVDIDCVRQLVSSAAPFASQQDEISRDVDWDRIVPAAKRHRLGPLLHRGVRNLETREAVPAPVRRRLEDIANIELARAVVRLHHLDEIAAVASERRSKLCLLKGIAFATSLYTHPGFRPMADIDVLVRPEDFQLWTKELERLGYLLEDTSDHAACFRRRQSGVYLELHRALTSCPDFLGIRTAELIERSTPAPGFEDPHVRTLTFEDHLLHLSLHASFQHGFRQPAVNAWDARLVFEQPQLHIETFLQRASSERLVTWVYGGLAMSHAVFPHRTLERALHSLADRVPARLRRKAAGLSPGKLLAAAPDAVFGSPYRRLTWSGGLLKTFVLLLEISRSRTTRKGRRAWPSWTRIRQLLKNHAFKKSHPAMMRSLQTTGRPDNPFTWRGP